MKVNCEKTDAVGFLVCGICAGALTVLIRKKIKQAHSDGWFSGFTEAARDYEQEIRFMRRGKNKNESSELI